jgi:uncharacterized protein
MVLLAKPEQSPAFLCLRCWKANVPMSQEVLIAVCLVLVIEGILPFLAPGQWRNAMKQVIELDDRSLRIMGLASMLIGTVLLYFVH